MRIVTTLACTLLLGISTAFAQTAQVQVVHNSPYVDVDTVIVYVDDAVAIAEFAYGEATAFLDLGINAKVDIVHKDSTDNANPLFTATLDLMENGRYVVFASGNPFDEETDNTQPFGLYAVADVPAAVTTGGNTDIAIFHGSPDAPAVAIKVRGADENVTDSLAFGNATGFLDLPASDIVVEIYTNVGGNLIASYNAPLSALADEVAVVFARGIFNNGNKFDPFGVAVVMASGAVLALDKVAEPIYPYPVNPETPVLGSTAFFIDGHNVDIPYAGGNTTLLYADLAPNRVLRTGGNDFGSRGWRWDDGNGVGMNMEGMIDDGDTLYLRMRVLPDDNPALGILITDMSRDFGPVTQDDIGFSVRWGIPEEHYDNTFREYAIPLPLKTKALHDTAKARGDITGDRARWEYIDAWSGSYSIGSSDPLWKDLTWYNVRQIGFVYSASGSGTVEVDYAYIGKGSEIDLDELNAVPTSPLPSISASLTTGGDSVTVSWTHDAGSDIPGYELYYAGTAAANYSAAGQNWLASFAASGDLTFTVPVAAGHPDDLENTMHFMIYATNAFSSVPASAVPSHTSVTYTVDEAMPYIPALTQEQEDAIVANFDAGTAGPEGFSDIAGLFEFNEASGRLVYNWGGNQLGPNERAAVSAYGQNSTPDEDFSAKIWIGYRNNTAEGYTTFYIYGEVMDSDIDELTFLENTGGTWQHDFSVMKDLRLPWNVYTKDMVNFYMGTYDVNYVTGASGLRKRGDTPDYFLSYTPYVNLTAEREDPALGMLSRLWLELAGTIDAAVGDSTYYYSSEHPYIYDTVFENMFLPSDHPHYNEAAGATGTANYMGYKFLAAIDSEDLLAAPGANDAVFEAPGDDEIKYIPFAIQVIDRDDESNWDSPGMEYSFNSKGYRVLENVSSVGPIGSVAVAGINKVVGTSNERADNTVPFKYSLDQNYPNPFNPSTAIKFSLPAAENVNLNVYNLLGQRVATLVSNQQFTAGVHTVNFDASRLASGVYFYRLETDGFTATKKMMLVK
jgi:hypothetical protein